jgi:DNA segregation ATPase FtsK/SpoIIIE-like protein
MFDVDKALRGFRSLSKDLFSNKSKWKTPSLDGLTNPLESLVERDVNYIPPIDPVALEDAFANYKIKAKFIDYRICPSVTVYEVKLPEGTRLQQVLRIERDLARDMLVSSLRIIELKDSANIGIDIQSFSKME